MKLYTQEQVIEVFEKYGNMSAINARNILDLSESIELPSDSLCINCDDSKSTHNICMDCIIKIGKENIQLPSDEEIIAKSKQEPDNSDIETAARIGYVAGAKWMRGKILQEGNK